jgi:CHU_C Type IX secretion signal domain
MLDGCLVEDSIYIKLEDRPIVDIGPEVVNNCENGVLLPITLKNVQPLDNYTWIPGGKDSTITVTQARTYELSTSNVCGTVSDAVTILGCEASGVYVPNAFAPDSGGENAHFNILGRNIVVDHLRVVDRWWHVVYEETPPLSQGWDGNDGTLPCQSGVYFWLAQYHTYEDATVKQLYGNVTLVR